MLLSRAKKVFGWLRGQKRGATVLGFQCNICGTENQVPRDEFSREVPSCTRCGSTVRMRSIIHVLSMELFGGCVAIDDFPESASELRGVGMSDWADYADRLAQKCQYQNTYYHQEPKLDITDPAPELTNALDFVVSTDVFEHVAQPVQRAFDNVYKILKPGGVFVMSVPYRLEGSTEEHFPEMHDFRIENESGDYVLYNKTVDGREQVFKDLAFHGGPGQTLEMRVFTLPDLRANFRAAGFEELEIYERDADECGMVWELGWGLTMAARKLPKS